MKMIGATILIIDSSHFFRQICQSFLGPASKNLFVKSNKTSLVVHMQPFPGLTSHQDTNMLQQTQNVTWTSLVTSCEKLKTSVLCGETSLNLRDGLKKHRHHRVNCFWVWFWCAVRGLGTTDLILCRGQTESVSDDQSLYRKQIW